MACAPWVKMPPRKPALLRGRPGATLEKIDPVPPIAHAPTWATEIPPLVPSWPSDVLSPENPEQPLVVLVGFGYWGTIDALPGTIVDLYRMVKVARQVLLTDRVVVVSDITTEETVENLRDVVLEGDLEPDVFTFMSRLVEENRLVIWRPEVDLVRVCRAGGSKLLVYFSGHGKLGALCLPNGALLRLDHFVDDIAAEAPTRQIVVVSDCCHAHTLRLPFVLSPGSGQWEQTGPCPKNAARVIALSASSLGQVSTTTTRGSAFTTRLADGLRRHFCLVDLLTETRTFGTPSTCSASFPEALDLFRWMRPRCRVERHFLGGYLVR